MILVLNVGSTSVKYELFDDLESVADGIVADIGAATSPVTRTVGDKTTEETHRIPDHAVAIDVVIDGLTAGEPAAMRNHDALEAVGHRVVHGGKLSEPHRIDEDVKATIRDYARIAPLHNPVNLAGIEAVEASLPDVPQVAVFDTAFHRTMPPRARLYGLRYEYHEAYNIERYGFHGISHEYVALEGAAMLGQRLDETTLVTCHLGGGCSMTAIEDGQSVDTTMGFSPLEGLVMATRPGDLDPTVVRFLVDEHGMALDEVFNVLNHESGLAGLSGVSDDMRELLAARADGHERSALAIDAFTYRVARYLGAYKAVLGEIDGIVFTAGIGENSPAIREEVCTAAPGLSLELDDAANRDTGGERRIISTNDSAIPVLVVPTDEERMIARETVALVGAT